MPDEIEADVLPMQQHFVEVKSLLVKFNLWSDTIATELEDDGFGVVFDAAHDSVVKYTGSFRVRPHRQLLQRISTLCLCH